MLKLKRRFKPKLKKFAALKVLLYNQKKGLSLKREKWKKYSQFFQRLNKSKKRNCYYKFYDLRCYNVFRFVNRFVNKFKSNLLLKKRFTILYGNFSKNYLKHLLSKSKLKTKSNFYKKIVKHSFICFLESRLDIILLKACFVNNTRMAKQLISHGNVKVNDKVVKTGSLILKLGDKVTLSEKIKPLLEYKLADNEIWPLPPKYLQVNYKIFQIVFVCVPISMNAANNFNIKVNFDQVMSL